MSMDGGGDDAEVSLFNGYATGPTAHLPEILQVKTCHTLPSYLSDVSCIR